MRRWVVAVGSVVLLPLLAGCVSTPEQDGTVADVLDTASPVQEDANRSAPDLPRFNNLTWFLNRDERMGPSMPTPTTLELTGVSDPGRLRDLIRFEADRFGRTQQLVNVSVHLILVATGAWQQSQDQVIECWFGFDGTTMPAQADAPESYSLAAGERVDVRFNLTLPPNGTLFPGDASAEFMCGIPGNQSPTNPLQVIIGGPDGGNASHIHPRGYDWRMPSYRLQPVYEGSGTLIPDASPAGPTSHGPIDVPLPPGALGFRAEVEAGSTPGADFDLEVQDRAGHFLAESNGPMGSEYILFVPFNLEAAPGGYAVFLENAGSAPASFTLTIEALVPP